MNIVHHFFNASKQFPDRIAIATDTERLTYGELIQEVRLKSGQLLSQGIKSEDRIMIMMPVGINFYITILSIFQIGAIVVLTDQLLPKSKVKYAFQKANCHLIITSSSLYFFRHFLFSYDLWGKIIHTRKGNSIYDDIDHKENDDSALITFTSGSTGHPKAADRTHGFLDIQLSTIIHEFGLSSTDVHLSTFPVVTLCNMAVGATAIIPNKKMNQALKPTFISASEGRLDPILELLNLDELSNIVIGGATTFPYYINELSEYINTEKIKLVYGGTEVEPITTTTGKDYIEIYQIDDKGVFVGKQSSILQILIVDPNDKARPVSEGNIGSILVKGEHVLDRYIGNDQDRHANKITINNERWHDTGDAGYIIDKKLYYFGRIKYLWKQNDEWVSPITLEKHVKDRDHQYEATWLCIHNQNVAFHNCENHIFEELVSEFPYKIDKKIKIKKLPKDKRHNSRIDYEKLKKRAY